jgi:hypothetical protein
MSTKRVAKRLSPSREVKGTIGDINRPMPTYGDKDRMTMVMHLHHEHRGDKPTSVVGRASMLLEGDEEPHSKRYEVGEQWEPIKLGDHDASKVGFVTIDNLTGKHPVVNPTEEERLATAEAIIEVSYSASSEESFWVMPGWVLVFHPSNVDKLSIRCRKGKANIRTTVFPK